MSHHGLHNPDDGCEWPRTNSKFLYSGYNPPQFAIDAAKDALDRVECNQYSPTKVSTTTLYQWLDGHITHAV